jgi:hypothetical protein
MAFDVNDSPCNLALARSTHACEKWLRSAETPTAGALADDANLDYLQARIRATNTNWRHAHGRDSLRRPVEAQPRCTEWSSAASVLLS